MKFAIIKNSEKDLLKEIAVANKNENSLWKIPNLLIPISAIILAILCFIAFSDRRTELIIYFNLILNGSLPLVAINQISSMGIHVFRFNKQKERIMNIQDTIILRTKLLYYSFTILVLSVIMFAYQVINAPHSNYLLIIFLLAVSIFLVWISSNVSKKIFLLQEDFLDRTFNSEIRKEAEGHGINWKKINL